MTENPTARAMHFVHVNWMLLDMKAECMACEAYRPPGLRPPHEYNAPEAMALAIDHFRAAVLAETLASEGVNA